MSEIQENEYFEIKKIFNEKRENFEIMPNSILIKSEKLYQKIIEEVKHAKNSSTKTAKDFRRLKRYEIIVLAGKGKLVAKKRQRRNDQIFRA